MYEVATKKNKKQIHPNTYEEISEEWPLGELFIRQKDETSYKAIYLYKPGGYGEKIHNNLTGYPSSANIFREHLIAAGNHCQREVDDFHFNYPMSPGISFLLPLFQLLKRLDIPEDRPILLIA